MFDTPEITEAGPRRTAVIHLTIPREEIATVMGPGIGELMSGLAAQGIKPAGPWFARYLNIDARNFELEIGVPVDREVAPSGRIQPGEIPGGRIARTIYRGPYEGLHSAWSDFGEWVKSNGHAPRKGLLETYLVGPETTQDPAQWRTELVQPLESSGERSHS